MVMVLTTTLTSGCGRSAASSGSSVSPYIAVTPFFSKASNGGRIGIHAGHVDPAHHPVGGKCRAEAPKPQNHDFSGERILGIFSARFSSLLVCSRSKMPSRNAVSACIMRVRSEALTDGRRRQSNPKTGRRVLQPKRVVSITGKNRRQHQHILPQLRIFQLPPPLS